MSTDCMKYEYDCIRIVGLSGREPGHLAPLAALSDPACRRRRIPFEVMPATRLCFASHFRRIAVGIHAAAWESAPSGIM